ncbi:D-alanyl-D-alanine carboxypeptidase/D-alanyl-D-alanine-endopeptidase [Pseudonocardia sp. DSM 110487]|uniref:D-alanyl-D-alanine carboxypeptidase/D-alanyl-D-alanine endopeptidase n=1 Tax=Pseudonocardia sp. DSM 110487 TaxID=2865833 RepID=UPI001C695050|nr:D-alanyl-D-alanine carboxypeptidase/D-alanyl-D-alanine-endopeptidase [Pseudonocardia sp. DSM 110487]QYN35520.1 D-alanyl-D-alanine carboxypeptidase/D-alanyl-D-alanine-endopeptidase [Pseudonocardia sp. DSM 110487]
MGIGRRIGDSLRLPSRGARRTIAVLVVLAVAGGAGGAIALAGPTLVQGLGLVAPPPAPLPPVPNAELGPLPPDAPVPTPQGLGAALDQAAADMPGRFAGVVIDAATDNELWGHTPERPLVPASTAKLITTAAALLALNPTDRLITRVVSGPDPGTVVLVGGGDPTLTALPDAKDSLYPSAPSLTELADAVKRKAPGPIRRVLVDTSRYTADGLAPGWSQGDVAAGFITPIEPVMLDGGRIDPKLQDGPRVSDPAMTAGRALADKLGVEDVEKGTAAQGATGIAAVGSAPVSELAEHALRTSDNVLAEVLAREVAVAKGAEPSYAGAAQSVLAALRQAGIDTSGAEMVDGSGLSTLNQVPARLLGEILAAAASPAKGPLDTQFLRPILTGLPVAGGVGTLDDRYARDGKAAAGRGVVRAKTGSLTGVSSLAGVVTDTDGRLLVFALMSNGASPGVVRPMHDAMAAELSRCGCRA